MGSPILLRGDVHGIHVFGIHEHVRRGFDGILLVIGFGRLWGFDLVVCDLVQSCETSHGDEEAGDTAKLVTMA
jgi:hypothetical protein